MKPVGVNGVTCLSSSNKTNEDKPYTVSHNSFISPIRSTSPMETIPLSKNFSILDERFQVVSLDFYM